MADANLYEEYIALYGNQKTVPNNWDEMFENMNLDQIAMIAQVPKAQLEKVRDMSLAEREVTIGLKSGLTTPIRDTDESGVRFDDVVSKGVWTDGNGKEIGRYSEDGRSLALSKENKWVYEDGTELSSKELDKSSWQYGDGTVLKDTSGIRKELTVPEGGSSNGQVFGEAVVSWKPENLDNPGTATAYHYQSKDLDTPGALGDFYYDPTCVSLSARNCMNGNEVSESDEIYFLHYNQEDSGALKNGMSRNGRAIGHRSYGRKKVFDTSPVWTDETNADTGIKRLDYFYEDTPFGEDLGWRMPDTVESAHGEFKDSGLRHQTSCIKDKRNGKEGFHFSSSLKDGSNLWEGSAFMNIDPPLADLMPKYLIDARYMLGGCVAQEQAIDFSRQEYLSPNMARLAADLSICQGAYKEEDGKASDLMPKIWSDWKESSDYDEEMSYDKWMTHHYKDNTEVLGYATVLSALVDGYNSVASHDGDIYNGTSGMAAGGIYVDEEGYSHVVDTLSKAGESDEKGFFDKALSMLGLEGISGLDGVVKGAAAWGMDAMAIRMVTGSRLIGVAGGVALQAIGRAYGTSTPILSLAAKIMPEGPVKDGLNSIVDVMNTTSDSKKDKDEFRQQLVAKNSGLGENLMVGSFSADGVVSAFRTSASDMCSDDYFTQLSERKEDEMQPCQTLIYTGVDNFIKGVMSADIKTDDKAEVQSSMLSDYAASLMDGLSVFDKKCDDAVYTNTNKEKREEGINRQMRAMCVPIYGKIQELHNNGMITDEVYDQLCEKSASLKHSGMVSLGEYDPNVDYREQIRALQAGEDVPKASEVSVVSEETEVSVAPDVYDAFDVSEVSEASKPSFDAPTSEQLEQRKKAAEQTLEAYGLGEGAEPELTYG